MFYVFMLICLFYVFMLICFMFIEDMPIAWQICHSPCYFYPNLHFYNGYLFKILLIHRRDL